ncbi:hypothetical protein DXG01_009455 [Tephrocybe rancida]|nr:hypothetical protein DXG01_009455 [Tephrocybe rancida]
MLSARKEICTSPKIVLASLVCPPKKRRIHKVVEKYQIMHCEKMRDLMRPWVVKYHKKYGTASLELLEVQVAEEDWEEPENNKEGEEDSEDAIQEEEMDLCVDDAKQAKMKQIKTTKYFKSWMLKARNKVAKRAWQEEPQEEPQEVKERVLQAIEEEKAEMLAMLDMEKEGLECSPEQQQFVSYSETVAMSESFYKWYSQYDENISKKFVNWLCQVYHEYLIPFKVPHSYTRRYHAADSVPDSSSTIDNNDLLSLEDNPRSASLPPPPAIPDTWKGPYHDDLELFNNTDSDTRNLVAGTGSSDNANIDPALINTTEPVPVIQLVHTPAIPSPSAPTPALPIVPTTSSILPTSFPLLVNLETEGAFNFPQHLFPDTTAPISSLLTGTWPTTTGPQLSLSSPWRTLSPQAPFPVTASTNNPPPAMPTSITSPIDSVSQNNYNPKIHTTSTLSSPPPVTTPATTPSHRAPAPFPSSPQATGPTTTTNHVNMVNASREDQPASMVQGTYWTSSNPAGENPTITFPPLPPQEASSARPKHDVQRKKYADGTTVPESASMLNGKRPCKALASEEMGQSKRKKA